MRTYLAEIYRLSESHQDEDGYISTSALADQLMVSAPAVNRMVNRLKELGLLQHEPYKGIHLTATGVQEALQQLRAHRIAEVFLTQVMGFDWTEVYDDAAEMSVALTPTLLNRMAAMSANPAYCPHGEPIPSAEGSIEDLSDFPMTASDADQHVRITRLRTRQTDRLQYLQALGLVPGKVVHVLHLAPFDGPLQLKIGLEYRIIGHSLAQLIHVVAAEAEE